MGDAHIAQGDSEFDGTGIETSITGRFKITLHKKGRLPSTLRVRC
jgi:acetamidase/formamidase